MDVITQRIPIGKKLVIRGDLNGHISGNTNNYKRVHGSFRYGVRNEGG